MDKGFRNIIDILFNNKSILLLLKLFHFFAFNFISYKH